MTSENRIAWLIALGLTGWLMYLLAPVLTPFIAAALLAYIGDPLCDRLQTVRAGRFVMPRSMAVVIVFLLTFVCLGLLVVLVGPLVAQQVGALVDALPGIIQRIESDLLPRLSDFMDMPVGEDIGLSTFVQSYGDMAGEWAGTVLLSVGSTGSFVLTAVMSLFLVPILTFYLLRDWDDFMQAVGNLVPLSQRETAFRLARETDQMLGAFLRGQLMVMFALAVLYSTGLTISGVDFAIAIGVVSGIVSFVPYLGLIFGIVLASLTVVLEPAPLWPMIGVILTFTIAQLIEGTVLTPKLVGEQIGLHPVIVILAIAAGGQLFGFFGILLALPAAAVLSVIVRFAYDRYLREHPELDT